MCLPSGFPSGMLYILPIQIVQNPKNIVIIPELQRAARIIPTDGRPHRTGIEPTYYGDSVGKWDGEWPDATHPQTPEIFLRLQDAFTVAHAPETGLVQARPAHQWQVHPDIDHDLDALSR